MPTTKNTPKPRYFTVRLAIERPDCSMTATYTPVHAQDADHAAAKAVAAAEFEFERTGWLLDGPVEEVS